MKKSWRKWWMYGMFNGPGMGRMTPETPSPHTVHYYEKPKTPAVPPLLGWKCCVIIPQFPLQKCQFARRCKVQVLARRGNNLQLAKGGTPAVWWHH